MSSSQAAPQDNNEDEEEMNKELMFEKVLTPSDVGKLNRLVIPKSHAEAHFPLGADGYSADGKGLLLNFEDHSGKRWRFRYSYWSSSQSYVLTKGWSRYVKENHLAAGDVVLFKRHRLHPNSFFVSWRRRHPGTVVPERGRRRRADEGTSGGDGDGDGDDGNNESVVGDAAVSVGWSSTTGCYPALSYPTHHQQHPMSSYDSQYFLHAGGEGTNETTMVEIPLSSGSRMLRLFGVNMECQNQQEETHITNYINVNNNSNNNDSETFSSTRTHHPN
ncbi:hypothetical protein PIB30_043536 [Stylosanthes scabra]|uniref:TF-B3 domain-containing protein n=1 Tax=Stylosanthes scabra TaxID=79078 RepID=A0ABU6VGL8_9FABA|nr:hypothetical protein [Stylosanthes scabra]